MRSLRLTRPLSLSSAFFSLASSAPRFWNFSNPQWAAASDLDGPLAHAVPDQLDHFHYPSCALPRLARFFFNRPSDVIFIILPKNISCTQRSKKSMLHFSPIEASIICVICKDAFPHLRIIGLIVAALHSRLHARDSKLTSHPFSCTVILCPPSRPA